MKIRSVGTELYRAEGADIQTGLTKLRVALRNFANAPKNKRHYFLTDCSCTCLQWVVGTFQRLRSETSRQTYYIQRLL